MNKSFKTVIPIATILILVLLVAWMAGVFSAKIAPGAVALKPTNRYGKPPKTTTV